MSLSWKRPDPLGDVASFRVTRTDSQGSASVDVPVDTSTREDGQARVGETVAWSVVGVDAAGATTAAATATLPVDGSSVAQVHVVERLDIDAFALGPGGLVFAGAVEDTITSGPFSYTRADAVDYVFAGGPAPRLIGRFTADSDDDTVYAVATEVDRASGDEPPETGSFKPSGAGPPSTRGSSVGTGHCASSLRSRAQCATAMA